MEISLEEYISSRNFAFPENKDDMLSSLPKLNKFEENEVIDVDKDDEVNVVEGNSNRCGGRSSDVDYIDIDYACDESVSILEDIANEQNAPNTTSHVDNGNNGTNGINFDLRDKISGNKMPPASSQQWRLMPPNIHDPRPAGMPPLMSINVPMPTSKIGWESARARNRRRRDVRRGYARRNNYRKNMNQSVREMVIQIDSQDVPLYSSKRTSYNHGAIENEMNILGSSQGKQNKPDSLHTLLSLNDDIKKDLLPLLASKFMQYLQNNDQSMAHKPIYDMQLQKEIHMLQKKPLRYSHKGQIVSSDGVGIDNCKVTPQASNVSLNYRFT